MKRIDDRPLLVGVAIFLVAVILVCGLAMEYGWFGYSAKQTVTPASVVTHTQIEPQTTLVNINTASEDLLDTLPQIGPALAQRIVEYRTENGSFTTLEDLKLVAGIGEATYEQLLPYITIES